MDINLLVKITSKAWSLQILSLLHEGIPGRQAPLLKASGAGRTAFVQSLHHLINLQLIERNPGHGHPLRPEFRLTETGKAISPIAHKILNDTALIGQHGLLRKTWTIPILAVANTPKYFSQIKFELQPVTDRALSQSLTQLQNQNWIGRLIDAQSRPPRPLYQAIDEGAAISRIIELA